MVQPSASSSDMLLQAKDLTKTVSAPGGELCLLNGANLAVNKGEVIAIVGPSGAGKSTLLGLLAGLDAASTGDVSLFGESLSGLDEDQRAQLRRGRVAFVFQNFQLLPGLDALENVQWALELAGLQEPARVAQEALAQVGLEKRVHHYPSQLSGGEQQRVALARAFALSPQLLFADEPTGNLDQATGELVMDVLFQLRDRIGCALVLVTHDMNLAARCDRRLTVRDGQLSADA
ncbi:MAG: ABC transporter ATP-binding protein [Granulosicoccaceae bacterium]